MTTAAQPITPPIARCAVSLGSARDGNFDASLGDGRGDVDASDPSNEPDERISEVGSLRVWDEDDKGPIE